MGRYTLIVVLGFIVIFGYLSMQANRTARRAAENSTKFYEKTMARQLAHSAMEYLLNLHTLHGIEDTIITKKRWMGGDFEGQIITNSYDSTSMESYISFIVTATYGGEIHTTKVLLRSRSLLIPVIPAAVGAFSNTIELSMVGNARIYGTDTNIDDSKGARPDLPAMTVLEEDDSVRIRNSFEGTTKLQGRGQPPSIEVFSEEEIEEIQAIAEAYKSVADYNLSSCDIFHGNMTLGSINSPVIVYISGSCTITGNLTGYGVLIAENLDFRGNVKWYGIILVVNPTEAYISSKGNAKMYGALIIGSPQAILSFRGNDRIYYSAEAIQIVENHIKSGGTNIKRVSTLSWWD